MPVTESTDCPRCGRVRLSAERMCALCGELFMAAEPVAARAPAPSVQPARFPLHEGPDARTRRRLNPLTEPFYYLLCGAAAAGVGALIPLGQRMGWFLSSLAHEMGHAAVGWFFGMPSLPAISLSGHAAAIHIDQRIWIALLVWGALAFGASRFAEKRLRIATLVAVGVLYPMFAFTGAREFLGLLGGHGGELAFTTVCFWRAITGGFTSTTGERGLYAAVGWYLMVNNLILTTGLVFSDAARSAYARNGSFGLTNDYIRVAEDVLGVPLPLVAFVMTLVALAILPLAFRIARR